MGRITPSLHGRARHHDHEFEGEALEQVGVTAADGVDGDKHPVDDAAGLGALAAADGGQQGRLLVQVDAPDVVVQAILQGVDRLGLVALALRRLAAGD